jgi:hypothetical protein
MVELYHARSTKQKERFKLQHSEELTALQAGRSRVLLPITSFRIFIDVIFPAALSL